MLKNSDLQAKSVAESLQDEINAIVVQTVGNKITLYRVSKKDDVKHIQLPM